MKPSEKLIQRIKTELGIDIPDGTIVKTLHTGRHQKAAGAWSWSLYNSLFTQSDMSRYGSSYTVAQCLKAKKLAISTRFTFAMEIYPE
jgi:hypothetical protein